MAARKKREPDPATQIEELRQALEGAEPEKLYLLRGDERYFRERGASIVRDRASELGYEVSVHATRDPDFDAGLLLGDLAGGSLFATARCVVVRDAGPLLKKQGKEHGPFVRAALAFLQSDAPGCLVVTADSVRADHALAKAAAEHGRLLGCRRLYDSAPPWNPDPRQAELVQWFFRLARSRRVELSPDQALYVVAATGNDLFALEAQLAKIAAGGGESVRELVGWSAAGSPFEVAEAIAGGDVKRAVGGAHALFRGGFAERDGTRLVDGTGLSAILLSSLVRNVRQALAGAEALGRGGDPLEGALRAGWTLPPRARPAFDERVRARDPREWRGMLEDVAELEIASRSGKILGADDFCRLALRWRRRVPAASRG